MHRLTAALAISVLVISTARADAVYRMVSGGWRDAGPHCQGALEVDYRGTDQEGTLRWREGPMDAWHVGQVRDVIPGFNRFRIESVDQSTVVAGTIGNGQIDASVTFFQRACDYRFVLQRL
jgi:hypothetical protein